ncbi:MAG: glycoside hydrolase family 2 protein, partial [Armatimonadota bacterium]
MVIPLSGSDWKILGLVPTEWVWRRIGQPDVDLDNLNPPAGGWIPATVPGDVQSDLLDAGLIPDPDRDFNSRACEWTSQRDWVYRKEFKVDPQHSGKRAYLRFEGVDFSCHVFLNGRKLGEHSGTFTPFEFDVSDVISYGGNNTLLVVVEHAPFEPDVQGQIGWTSRIRLWKPRFAYQWDWCTRLVPLGIWDDVLLIISEEARITDVWVRPEVSETALDMPSRANVRTTVEFSTTAPLRGSVAVSIANPEGEEIASTAVPIVCSESGTSRCILDIPVENPRLWYPNGSGEQPLYTARSAVIAEDGRTLDERTIRFGIRRVRAVPNDSSPPGALPYVLEVNGIKTFIKGWNWVPIRQLYGRLHEREYRRAVEMAKRANCNLLRVWGGGLLERELFYNLCDEAGIMVWQEFPQSSSGIDNEPSKDSDYLAYVRLQAEQMVVRRRNHPCLVIWCGGNELFTKDFKPLDMNHPNIAALRRTVQALDPDRIFLPTSPSGPVFGASPEYKGRMHDVHGNWTYLGDPEHYRFFNEIDPLLHSEFGVEGAANLDTLKRALSEKHLWPPDSTNPAWVHHGSWWINRERVEALFGRVNSIEDFVKASQWLQAEGLRYAVEATRRRKFRTAGAIPWQFNEPWPNASCTNVLDCYGRPKPAYWTVRTAYAPYLVSAEYDRIRWEPNSQFRAALWLNASRALPPDCELVWMWYDAVAGKLLEAGKIPTAKIQPPCALRLHELCLSLPPEPSL